MYGFVPVKLPRLLSRLLEKVLGCDAFPAKSGKEENSIEKDTNACKGIPASGGVEPSTVITEACLGGPTVTTLEVQRAVHPSNE